MTSFDSHIQGSKPTVVEFCSEWSIAGRLMSAVMKEVYEKAGERAIVLKVDIDQEPALAQQYEVSAVPCIIIFKKGQITWRKNGIAPVHEILDHLGMIMQ